MSPKRPAIGPHEIRPTGVLQGDSATDQSQFYAQVLEAVGDSVIFTDLQGRIRYWNRGAEEVFGYSATEMLEQTPAILYPNANPESLAADLQGVLAGKEYVGTWQGRRKGGATVWV